MKPYPVMMNLDGKQVVVVGGGRVALRKIKSLLLSGAEVVVISPDVVNELRELATKGTITWIPERFHELLLTGTQMRSWFSVPPTRVR